MNMSPLCVYLHGLNSSPASSKGSTFLERGFALSPLKGSDSCNLHDIYRIKFNYCDPAAIATRRVYQQSKVLTVKNGLGRLRLFTKIHERVELSSSTALGIRDKKYL